MSLEIAWKQNILVTDFHLLKSLLVVFGLGLQTFVCDFSRQNICSVAVMLFLNYHISHQNGLIVGDTEIEEIKARICLKYFLSFPQENMSPEKMRQTKC